MTKALEQRLHRVYWGRGMPLSKSSQWDTRASMCTHKDKIKLRINVCTVVFLVLSQLSSDHSGRPMQNIAVGNSMSRAGEVPIVLRS